MIYDVPPPDVALTQGDILDGCPVFGLDVPGDSADLNAAPAR
jgi:hypothetical protein